jgi:hypothetical protein
MNPESTQSNQEHLVAPSSNEVLSPSPISVEQAVEKDSSAETQPKSEFGIEGSGFSLPASLPAPILTSDNHSSTSQPATYTGLDDDTIEDNWIKAAKQVVEVNREDPHKQNQEVDNLKINYRKTKYGEGGDSAQGKQDK